MSLSEEAFESLRIALMGYYNSQSITHAGYIIALTVGLLTIVSRWSDLTEYMKEKWHRKLVLLLILSFILGLIVYFSLRIIYWSTLSNQVMTVTNSEVKPSADYPTYISALQGVAINKLRYAMAFNLLLQSSVLTEDYSYIILFLVSAIWAVLASPIFFKNWYMQKIVFCKDWCTQKIRKRKS